MITLRTDNEGMNALSGKKEERNKVSEVLNALANKLYYKPYKDGETNLKGKVEIAEGLTAQSASYRLEDMTFKKENGQGQYLFTPATEDLSLIHISLSVYYDELSSRYHGKDFVYSNRYHGDYKVKSVTMQDSWKINRHWSNELSYRNSKIKSNYYQDYETHQSPYSLSLIHIFANKLYYTAYKDGETNLKGKVEIAESLTASSVTKRIEDISFRKDNGQGEYKLSLIHIF